MKISRSDKMMDLNTLSAFEIQLENINVKITFDSDFVLTDVEEESKG